jgi:hypothetical protein
VTTFFNELGSGSPMEVPEGSTEDDDVSFEKQQQVDPELDYITVKDHKFSKFSYFQVVSDIVPRERC